MSVNISTNITVTEAKQSLFTILVAINPNAPRQVALLEIVGDDGQTAVVYVGNSQLADNNFAFKITNSSDIFRDSDQGGINTISIPEIYLKAIAAGGSQIIHCRVRCF